MPRNLGTVLVDAGSYCSAPPLATSSRLLLPPRISRAQEARRPRTPLREVKREVRESEPDSTEYAIGADDVVNVKPDIGPVVERDPRQLTARVAAIAIRQAPSAASSPEAQRPSTSNYRTQALCTLQHTFRPARPGRPASKAGQTRLEGWADQKGLNLGLGSPP